ncbi:DUF2182 domain-containing protein [Bordetella genomosp. 9]|uniref:Metal-binding protein n=1 Tax=Bordetella genomosp. 9 TaxID=1416803 RepID=A0A1W6YWI6_9BORD|nr:DUF2182 domain-containing protein [Bordetella genomosp. 9]ARP85361.1 hypothetical protein CAL13_03365 [Bordetella genomosp. 9]
MNGAAAAASRPRQRRIFLPILAALIALSWAALWAWARSPYGRYLDHGDWTATGPAAYLCRAIPAGDIVVPAVLYGVAWILMTAAMMLPTVLPLFDIFGRLTARRRDRGRLLVLLGLGYMTVWAAFGALAHGLHAAVLALLARAPVLAWNGWLIGVACIALAGAFQFSRLKYRCLDSCRTPLSFVIRHWRGGSGARQAFVLGAHHGLFCVGCCWALMLLMFAVGMGSLGWMLLLASAMAIEKNLSWGARIRAPLGAALLALAVVMVAARL